MELNIIFENENYFVINKPSALVVHPACGNYDNTLVNALIGKLSQAFPSEDIRPGIIHRLDKDT
jgi:23S rRNA pseudouridine1911/1915/1917 synthase